MRAAGIRNEITCTVDTAMLHLLCIHATQKSMPEIENFPADLIKADTQRKLVWVDSLFEVLGTCYQNASLPSSSGIPWAKCGKEIDMKSDPYFKDIVSKTGRYSS